MSTQIFSSSEIAAAARLIRRGEVVAFPTETVFGLGANALDSKAVKKIFKAKGRPQDNPLIVHISRKADLAPLVSYIPDYAKLLMKHFWPGPLTLIFAKSDLVPKITSAGLETIAVRFPSHRLARSLISLSKVPLAAPSANLSGKPSGTSFRDVLEDFEGKIAGVIRSRCSSIGLESTVVDCTGKAPIVLRPGSVTLEDVRDVVPSTKLHMPSKKIVGKPKSPGLKYKHYAPKAEVILFEKSAHTKFSTYKSSLTSRGKRVRTLFIKPTLQCSRSLFSFFRDADRKNIDVILVKSIDERGLGLAIMNRVRKAASRTIR